MRTLLAVVWLTACAPGQAPPSEVPGQTSRQGEDSIEFSPLAIEVAPPAPTVVLITAGAAPHQLLRLTYTEGSRAEMTLRSSLAMKIEIDGLPIEARLPTTLTTSQVTVTQVRGDRFRLSHRVVGFEIDDQAASGDASLTAHYRAELERMIGLEGGGVIDSRGAILSSNASRASTRLSVFGDALSNLAAALPLEPVGVGGQWNVSEDIETDGVLTKRETLFEVVAQEANTVTLRYSVTQKAGDEAMTGPPDAKTELAWLSSTISGEKTLALDMPSPAALRQQGETTSRVNVTSGGRAQRIDTEMSFELALVR